MKKILLAGIALLSLSACQTTGNSAEWSAATNIPQQIIDENCKGAYVKCDYDKLKDNLEISVMDYSSAALIFGSLKPYNLEMSWVSGNNLIRAAALYEGTDGDWIYAQKAEIYIGKDVVAVLDGDRTTEVGDYNNISGVTVYELMKGTLTVDEAHKIASANPENVTVRFYGRDGYTDSEGLTKDHNLMNVVNLAKGSSN